MNKDSKPKVSVIIPTYNGEKTLLFTLKSVLNQTFKDFEILVIGDASTDSSEQIIKELDNDKIFWFNRSTNSGSQPAPNNEGLKRAKGKYIAYLGHDDLWFSDHLEKCLGFMKESKLDFVYSLIANIDPSKNIEVIGYDGKDIGRIQPVSPCSWIHKRELVEKIGWWNEDYLSDIISPDFNYFLRLKKVTSAVNVLKEVTVIKFVSANFKSYSNDSTIGSIIQEYWKLLSSDEIKFRNDILNDIAYEHGKNPFRIGVTFFQGFRLVRLYVIQVIREKLGNIPVLRWFFILRFRILRKSFNKSRGLNSSSDAK
jgi:glycosyltransferase involved in cell wall biosynthesis